MKIPYTLAITAALILNPLLASAAEGTFCDGLEAPLITVADFDGNGIVNSKDIAMLAKNIGKKGVYSPIFDRNGDGVLNGVDVHNSARTMGQTSTTEEQTIATAADPCAGTGASASAGNIIEDLYDGAPR
ncbi:MAG: hypothetical protein KAT06_01850 [Gammaproteobacteria bacterium]|nr:hypothetical protein [Gammaproteobacteria bacterium]